MHFLVFIIEITCYHGIRGSVVRSSVPTCKLACARTQQCLRKTWCAWHRKYVHVILWLTTVSWVSTLTYILYVHNFVCIHVHVHVQCTCVHVCRFRNHMHMGRMRLFWPCMIMVWNSFMKQPYTLLHFAKFCAHAHECTSWLSAVLTCLHTHHWKPWSQQ